MITGMHGRGSPAPRSSPGTGGAMQPTPLVPPIPPRYTVSQQGGALRITLPSRRQWLLLVPNALFVVVWLLLVIGLLTAALPALLSDVFSKPTALAEAIPLLLFGLVWIGLFSLGGLTALYAALWNLAGREVIEVSRQSLRLSRAVPGWTQTQEYQSAHIRDLRVSPQVLPLFYRQWAGWFNLGAGRGQLAFDYGARTVRFADADEAEAKMILAEILRRFPQYAPALDQVTGQPAPAAQSW